MKAVLLNLRAKQANLQRSHQQADLRVLLKERELVEAKEARAACQAGLQIVNETIAEIEAAPAPTTAPAPTGDPKPTPNPPSR